MSWHSFKSFFPSFTSTNMFEKIVKRCGRFLTRLSLKFSTMDFNHKESILSIIANECTNLQYIDLGDYWLTKKIIKLFQPNFHKVEIFKCDTDDLDDKDLNELFLKNSKLQHLKIVTVDSDGSFLDSLSKETLTYLELLELHIDSMNYTLCTLIRLYFFKTILVLNVNYFCR